MAYEGERYGLEVECEYMDCHTRMVLNEEGDYVQHFEYAKLETELRDTRRALEIIVETCLDKPIIEFDWATDRARSERMGVISRPENGQEGL